MACACSEDSNRSASQYSLNRVLVFHLKKPCEDPEGGQGVLNPPKNHKNIGFSSNTGPDPLKNCSYQASIQCWATIAILCRYALRADDGPLIVVLLDPPAPNQKKKKKKRRRSWTPSNKTFWIRTWIRVLVFHLEKRWTLGYPYSANRRRFRLRRCTGWSKT